MTSGLIDTRFLDALATSEPTPGGGSAAAMAAAIAAGLLSMVCNLTVGQEKFAAVESEMRTVLQESESLRRRLIELAEEDMAAYQSFVEAQHLPRRTTQERQARTQCMQVALKDCAAVPLEVARACRRLLELSVVVAEKGNPSAVTDVGVAALLAEACLRGAGLQVRVNLAWLKDRDLAAAQEAALAELLAGAEEIRQQALATVERVMAA